MIKINELYDLVMDLLDKNNSKFLTQEEFSRYAHLSSLELFDECVGATNKKLDNRTTVAYGKSQNTDKRLEPFRKAVTIQVVDGEASLPTNCQKITAVLTSRLRPKALTRVDEDRLGMLFDNPLREPDEDDIYYIEGNKTLDIYGLQESVYLKYLSTPLEPKYGTKEIQITVGTRTVNREVFDEESSINLEWNETETLDIANRILAKAGVPMKDSFVEQMVNVSKNNE